LVSTPLIFKVGTVVKFKPAMKWNLEVLELS
jgi:hypothetical protein